MTTMDDIRKMTPVEIGEALDAISPSQAAKMGARLAQIDNERHDLDAEADYLNARLAVYAKRNPS